MKFSAKIIAINALVASLYVVLTLPFGTLALNPYLQIRPAEALTVLPAVAPCTVIGLTIGCAVSNVFSAFGIVDVLLGAAVTLVAGLLTAYLFNKPYFAPIPPTLLNALFMPLVWLLSGKGSQIVWLTQALSLFVSQAVVCFGLGIPLYFATYKKLPQLLQK